MSLPEKPVFRFTAYGLFAGKPFSSRGAKNLTFSDPSYFDPSYLQKPDVIVPVPLHKSRYRQRGFNQALEIARTVSKDMQVPLDVYSCQRQHDTPQQSQLPAKQRRKNLKNAFAVVRPLNAAHVAILDDVMTTGSTVHELAKVLKKAGVAKVDVWVCARAVR
jgi:ComF family protein